MSLFSIKRSALSVLVVPGAAQVFRPFMRERATIFMLHRFDGAPDGKGHSVRSLRTTLDWLRKHRFPLLSLRELVESLERGDTPSRAVVFTIDDGYREQAAVAGPAFAEFDCPVTTFLTTGFLDGQLWLWWDRADYLFSQTERRDVAMDLGGRPFVHRWNTANDRFAANADFVARCKRMPDDAKHAAIGRLADAFEVDLPSRPPQPYAPMSWDDARAAERGGMSFGPHTVSHPVLSQTTDECLVREIGGSWQRLEDELAAPVPVFCFPHGEPGDYGQREIEVLRQLKLRGALLSTAGYASPEEFRRSAAAPFELPRYSCPQQLPEMIQVVAGVERLKGFWRGERPLLD
jgi:peptidoglycan/xylan/chitin deacetylase (PgdA/CDA1 family)